MQQQYNLHSRERSNSLWDNAPGEFARGRLWTSEVLDPYELTGIEAPLFLKTTHSIEHAVNSTQRHIL